MQRINFDDFFSRKSDFIGDDHPLDRALARVPHIYSNGPWLAGGAIRRTLMGQPLESDFDFFFANEEQFTAFVHGVKSRGGYQVGSNEHNTTLRLPSTAPKPVGDDEFEPAEPEITIQAIRTRWYSTLEEVLDSFDFTICQLGFDGVDIVAGDYTLWDLGRRRLVPHKITYGTSSMRRMLKYTKQGFTICAGSLSHFLEQVVADPSVIQSEILYID